MYLAVVPLQPSRIDMCSGRFALWEPLNRLSYQKRPACLERRLAYDENFRVTLAMTEGGLVKMLFKR